MTGPVLVTGAAGFAGGHLLDALVPDPDITDIVAWRRPTRAGGSPPRATPSIRVRWEEVDLLHRESVARAIERLRPSAIFHLAGAANVSGSWQHIVETLRTNVIGTHILLDAVRASGLAPRLLIPGSALIYRPASHALGEDAEVRPVSPYGLSKLAQERLAARWARQGGQAVLLARPFTHVGPGQSLGYAASSFAHQIAKIEAGLSAPRISVGNLESRRDLTDVRDIVHAYRLLMARGVPLRPYNICSGRAYQIGEVLDLLLGHACVRLDVEVDASRLRPDDYPLLLGDPTRIRQEVGWEPRIGLSETLKDLLEYWRGVVRRQLERPVGS